MPFAHKASRLAALGALCSLGSACNVYDRHTGEFNAGAVDPAKFPAAYLGLGGKGNMPGSGAFVPALAKVKGKDVSYYAFPLPPVQADAEDPLDVEGVAPPLGYVFDPTATGPIPTKAGCQAPDRYMYDPQKDAVRLDEQGSIFTLLPDADGYAPLVAQVPVTSAGALCQDIKSEETLLKRSDVNVPKVPPPSELPDGKPAGKPDGKLLAWAIIDPAARVLAPGESPDDPGATGLGLQRFGWYDHFLLAYLDGGYAPTATVMGKQKLVTQKLYYPAQVLDDGAMDPRDAKPGEGFDVLEAARGEAGYSPICEARAYAMVDMDMKPVVVSDVKDIDPMSIDEDNVQYFYCLQVR